MSHTTKFNVPAWYAVINHEGRCKSWGRDVIEMKMTTHLGTQDALILTFVDGKTSRVPLNLKDRYFTLTNEFYRRTMTMHEWIETLENTYG